MHIVHAFVVEAYMVHTEKQKRLELSVGHSLHTLFMHMFTHTLFTHATQQQAIETGIRD